MEILHRRQSKSSCPKQVSHLSANRFPSFLLKKTFTGKTRPSCEFSLHFPVKPWWKPPGRAVSLAAAAMARSWECLWRGSIVEAWFEKTVCSEKMWILNLEEKLMIHPDFFGPYFQTNTMSKIGYWNKLTCHMMGVKTVCLLSLLLIIMMMLLLMMKPLTYWAWAKSLLPWWTQN